MDFARKQMEKYGWQEGKGLGKNENGISKALKPTLKFDNTGLGHDPGKDFTNKWWENLYNKASKNIEVESSENSIKMALQGKESIDITTKDYTLKDFKKGNRGMYGKFLHTAKLTAGGEIAYKNKAQVMPRDDKPISFTTLTDEQLFAACEGRTAHKGARHGLKLSGKLSRIEKQEQMLLKRMRNVSISDDENEKIEKKLKKISKSKDVEDEPVVSSGKKKKKKKKRCKHDTDMTSKNELNLEATVNQQNKIKGENKKQLDDLCVPDEGIEQDCDMKSTDTGQQCFEEVQSTKKKKKSKRDRATDRFLREVLEADPSLVEKLKRKRNNEEKLKKWWRKQMRERNGDEVPSISSIMASLDQVCRISGTE